MARYDKQHKEATRLRILETAGRRLKADGIDGSGVAVLMKDAGLTNGAFYAHFESKDALVSEVVARELNAMVDRLAAQPPGPAAVATLVDDYLTTTHRDDVAGGCPSAALLGEIARGGGATRDGYTRAVARLVEEVATRLGAGRADSADGARRRTEVRSAYALMVGTVQLARTMTDRESSDQLVEQSRGTVLGLLGLRGR